jgi:hypothetical protein
MAFKLPKVIYKIPWWWQEFITKMNQGQIYAKGDKGDTGNPGLPGDILSNPPPGCRKVKNIYVNQAGKAVVEYDDTPV